MLEYSELLSPSRVTQACFIDHDKFILIKGGTNLQIYTVNDCRLLDEIKLQAAVTSLTGIKNTVYITFKTAKMSVVEYKNRKFETKSLHFYEKVQNSENFSTPNQDQPVFYDPQNNNFLYWFQKSQAAIFLDESTDPLLGGSTDLNSMKTRLFHQDILASNFQLSSIVDLKLLPKYAAPTLGALCWSKPSWSGLIGVDGELTKCLVVVQVDNLSRPVLLLNDLPYNISKLVPLTGKLGPLCLLLGNERVHVLSESGVISAVDASEDMSSCWAAQFGNVCVIGLSSGHGIVLDLRTLKWCGSAAFGLRDSELLASNHENMLMITSPDGFKLFDVNVFIPKDRLEADEADVMGDNNNNNNDGNGDGDGNDNDNDNDGGGSAGGNDDDKFLEKYYANVKPDDGLKIEIKEMLFMPSYCFGDIAMISGALALSTSSGILLSLADFPFSESLVFKLSSTPGLGRIWAYNDEDDDLDTPLVIQSHNGRTHVFNYDYDRNDNYVPHVKVIPHLEGPSPIIGVAEYDVSTMIFVQERVMYRYDKRGWTLNKKIDIAPCRFVEIGMQYMLLEHDDKKYTVYSTDLEVVYEFQADFASCAENVLCYMENERLFVFNLELKKLEEIINFSVADLKSSADDKDDDNDRVISIQAMVLNNTPYIGIHFNRNYTIHEIVDNNLYRMFSPPFPVGQSPIYLHFQEALIFPSTNCMVLKSSLSPFRCMKLDVGNKRIMDVFPYSDDEFCWLDSEMTVHVSRFPSHIDGTTHEMPTRFVETDHPVDRLAYHDETNQLFMAGGGKAWSLNVDEPLTELLSLDENEVITSMACIDYGQDMSKQYLAVGTSVPAPEDKETNGYVRLYKVLSTQKLQEIDHKYVRGPVSSVSESMGYLIASHGYQIHAYNVYKELDPIGFFDGKIYFQDLKPVRNILIFGEKLGPPRLVNFCIQPHRLDILSSADPENMSINAVGAVSHYDRGDLIICTCTDDNQILFDTYDPDSTESLGGTKLVHLTSFFTNHQCNATTLAQIDDNILTIGCCSDGTVFKLNPINEPEFRSLYVLTQQLMEKEQSIGGINLKNFRTLLTGTSHSTHVIDGELAQTFWQLEPKKQAEYARKLGVDGLVHLYKALDRRVVLDI